jgi:hypothetical protein
LIDWSIDDLHRYCLQGNDIGESGIGWIARALQANTTLSALYLDVWLLPNRLFEYDAVG